MQSKQEQPGAQNISRSPGNEIDQEDRFLALAETDPRQAMFAAADYYGDGSACSGTSCNIAITIAYGRYLEGSLAEQKYVLGLPDWVGNPPDMSDALLIALRLRYLAWKTKTAAYERAQVHATAMRPAYQGGIQPRQVRGYLAAHSLDGLYDWARKGEQTDLKVDLSGTQQTIENGRLRGADEESPSDTHIAEPSPPGMTSEDVFASADSGNSPPSRKPPRTPRYDGEELEGPVLHIIVSQDDFDIIMEHRDDFTLRCRYQANGQSTWVRVQGSLI